MTDRKLINCLDDVVIHHLLHDQLTPEEQRAVESHLGDCESCQKQVESTVTNNNGWIDLKNQLSTIGLEDRLDDPETDSLEAINLDGVLGPTDDPAMLGRLGRYEICGVIGQGSMGLVFKALDPRLNRFVAIKLLANGYASAGSSRKRFEREGRAIAAVRDPHVVEIHGVEEFRGIPYIVMQFIPGGSLQNFLDRNGPVSTEAICRIGMQIAKGLDAAHRQGIVHRDIKPANILLEDGHQIAVVSDFGLARVADEVTMTRTGAIAGTPEFMSPEQARGNQLDTRSDLFSLGTVFYALCTGCSPFRSETLMGVIHQVCDASPRPIKELNPDIDDWLIALTDKLLSKDRDERIQTAAEVARILESELAFIQSPSSTSEPDRSWWTDQTEGRIAQRFSISKLGLLIGLLFAILAFSLNSYLNWPVGQSNQWGVRPTIQESNIVSAKAAYDLAYQTHLTEAKLRGDMAESISRHKQALELGYDRPQSAYNIARAYAYQANVDDAFQWLATAVSYGFHDHELLAAEKDLRLIRKDVRYVPLLNRVSDLYKEFQLAEIAYFVDEDYQLAETLYRNLLKQCPNDEFSTMMIGASLLEQGKFDESIPWHEKTRKSVRFANFGSYNLGCVAAHKGDFELAFSYLNHSVDTGFTDIEHLKDDHQLAAIRDLPEFKELISRMEKLKF